MFCETCKTYLAKEWRKVTIRGAYLYFCPTNSATLSPDCLNEYCKDHPVAQRSQGSMFLQRR